MHMDKVRRVWYGGARSRSDTESRRRWRRPTRQWYTVKCTKEKLSSERHRAANVLGTQHKRSKTLRIIKFNDERDDVDCYVHIVYVSYPHIVHNVAAV